MKRLVFFILITLTSHNVFSAERDASKDKEMLRAICDNPTQITQVSYGKSLPWGCSACPAYTSFKGSKLQMRLDAAYFGTFMGAGEESAVVSLRDCEPHSDGFGGVALLKKSTEGWVRIGYQTSESLANCIPFQTKAKSTELFCEESDMHTGTSTSWFEQIAYKDPQHFSHTRLLKDIEFGANTAGGSLENGYCYSLVPESWSVTAQSPLKIKISGSGGMIRSQDSDCESDPPKTLSFTIELVYDGSTFNSTSQSHQAIEDLDKFNKSLRGAKRH